MELKFDWRKDKFDLVKKCVLKNYNAEVHAQSLIEAALDLKTLHRFDASEIVSIEVSTFLTVYHIIGGGEYGERMNVQSKEQADHSLPYILAATLLDDQLYPEQFSPKRIMKGDVQNLLKKVKVKTNFPLHKPKQVAGVLDPYTAAYPDKLKGKLTIKLKNGKEFSLEKEDYYGFFTRPLYWTDVEKKFKKLTQKIINEKQQDAIIDVIQNLETKKMQDLFVLLHKIGKGKRLITRHIGKYKKAG